MWQTRVTVDDAYITLVNTELEGLGYSNWEFRISDLAHHRNSRSHHKIE